MPLKPCGLSVSALIDDGQGRYLLLRRARASKHFAGQWNAPGGKVRAGESFDAALLREVLEETGLNVALDGVAGVTEFELPHIRVVLLYMKAHVVNGELCLNEEHDQFAWLPPTAFATKNLSLMLSNFLRDCGTEWH